MIIWSGLGFLPVVVLFASVFLFSLVLPEHLFDVGLILGFLITAAFSWLMGKRLNEVEGRTVIDKKTGEEVTIKPNHSLFWIKMEYWAFVAVGLAILSAVQAYA